MMYSCRIPRGKFTFQIDREGTLIITSECKFTGTLQGKVETPTITDETSQFVTDCAGSYSVTGDGDKITVITYRDDFSPTAEVQSVRSTVSSEYTEEIQKQHLIDLKLITVVNDEIKATDPYEHFTKNLDLRSVPILPQKVQFYYARWRQTSNKGGHSSFDRYDVSYSSHLGRLRGDVNIAVVDLNRHHRWMFQVTDGYIDIPYFEFQQVQKLYLKRMKYIPLTHLIDNDYFIWVLCDDSHPFATRMEDIPLLTR